MNLNAKPFLWIIQHPLIHSVLFLAIFFQNALRKNLLDQDLWAVFLNTLPVACVFLIMSALVNIFTRHEQPAFKPKITHYPKLQTSDIEKTTVHEAGHLIGMALFQHPPQKITIRINAGKTRENLSSANINYSSEIRTMIDMKACIKMLLASSCAEQILLSKTYCGSDDDLEQIEYVARKFLQSFAGIDLSANYPWFRKVESPVEARINAQSINDLIRDFRAETLQFVKKNEYLLHEIKNHIKLNHDKELKNEWCQSVLKKVNL